MQYVNKARKCKCMSDSKLLMNCPPNVRHSTIMSADITIITVELSVQYHLHLNIDVPGSVQLKHLAVSNGYLLTSASHQPKFFLPQPT